jgi:hypothetical protein
MVQIVALKRAPSSVINRVQRQGESVQGDLVP